MSLTRRSIALFVLFLLVAVWVAPKLTDAAAGEASKVWWLDDPAQVSGAEVPEAYSTLLRGYFSMTISLHTSGLTPGHNYSVWWAIFQNPGACSGGCGDDDINAAMATGANPAGIGVHFGGSLTAPESGVVDVGSRMVEDMVDGCAKVPPYSAVCEPLRDAATASALVFLVDHGPGVAPSAAFDAGCRDLVWFGYVVARYNKGDFDCYRAQSTYHTP